MWTGQTEISSEDTAYSLMLLDLFPTGNIEL
jgi:hypothetical protein